MSTITHSTGAHSNAAIKPDYHPRLTNEDLAPLKKQTWTPYNIFAFWMADVHSVGGYITAAYWFTSSTSFANPAVTVARMFSDTFAGIEPASVPMFVLMQVIGGTAAAVLVRLLYPSTTLARTPERIDA